MRASRECLRFFLVVVVVVETTSSRAYIFLQMEMAEVRAVTRALRLNSIADNVGSRPSKTRVGRGIGSGKGKTCGRGHGGQLSRTGQGKPRWGFEGGQTPLFKRVGKFGFTNYTKLNYSVVNVSSIQEALDDGRLSSEGVITQATLYQAGLLGKKVEYPGVCLLANGKDDFNQPVKIEVARASLAAIAAVEKCGGSVVCQYYAPASLRKHLAGTDSAAEGGNKDCPPPRLFSFYSSADRRGFLSSTGAGEPATSQP